MVCGLLSWGPLCVGGLAPKERLIVLNASRRSLFKDDAGLYNTVVGHELAHWRLHVDRAMLDHPSFPGWDTS